MSKFQKTGLFSIRQRLMFQVIVFMMVRTMAVILMILTLYVTEQGFNLVKSRTFGLLKTCDHRQDADHI